MTEFEPQPSEQSATQPPDASGESRRTGRSSDVEAGVQPPPERRSSADGAAAQPAGEAVVGRGDPHGSTRPHSVDELFVLVTDRRRRRLLSVLGTVDGPIAVSRLASEIAARSDESARTAGSERAVEISLVHEHLPRLASMDLITYDRDRRRVRPTAEFARNGSRLRSLVAAGDRIANSPE